MVIGAAVLAVLASVAGVLTVTVKVDMNGILTPVSVEWAAAVLVAAEILGIFQLHPQAALLTVPLGVVGTVNIWALMDQEVVASPANPLRMVLPDLSKGDMVRLKGHGVFKMVPIADPYHSSSSGVNICDAGLAILDTLEDNSPVILCLLRPSADGIIVPMIQGIEFRDELETAPVRRRVDVAFADALV